MATKGRINKELKELMRDNNIDKNNYAISEVNEVANNLKGIIRGPPGTPYAGGVFTIDIDIPYNYPFFPPKCKFVTKIWHPNISSVTGAICLDVLKDQWAAAMTIGSVLISLQTFLSSPEPNDPQDAVVANQYHNRKLLFDKTAKYWTYIYGMDEQSKRKVDNSVHKEYDYLVEKVMKQKKTSRDEAIAVLSCCDWSFEKAIQR